jgi:hypothetical protein
LWTDGNLPQLQNQAEFDATVSFTQKTDLLRYEVLHQYGGVFVDADCVCLRPLDDLTDHELFAGSDNQECFPGRVAPGVIGCWTGHPILKTCVDHGRPVPALRGSAMVYTAGPVFFSSVLFAYRVFAPDVMESVKIYPERLFYAFRWGTDTYFDFGGIDECYFFHAWGSRHGYHPEFVARIMRLIEQGKPAAVLPPGRQLVRLWRFGEIPTFVRPLCRRLGLVRR